MSRGRSDVPKITVVMPTFNAERFVRGSVASVVMQSFQDWELLVLDGGSTDATLDLVEQFRDPRITVRQEPDDGPDHAIVKSLPGVSGEYFMMLCASDGYAAADWLEACAYFLDEDPALSLVWGVIPNKLWLPFLNPKLALRFSRERWLFWWIGKGPHFPDPVLCVRASVFRECLDPYTPETRGFILPGFYLRFNTRGYMPFCLPKVVGWSVPMPDAYGTTNYDYQRTGWQDYERGRKDYAEQLFLGKEERVLRDGRGEVLETWPFARLITEADMVGYKYRAPTAEEKQHAGVAWWEYVRRYLS